MEKRYNYLGEDLGTTKPKFISPKFMKTTPEGKIVPNWAIDDGVTVDDNGFDRTNVECNGRYIEDVELPRGTKLCRYGKSNGYTTALLNTPYEKLGLPYVKETQEYHEYEVIADGLTVKCIVTRGRVAPMFNSPGGAIQFLHKVRIIEEINSGKLKEVTSWLNKKN